MEVYGKSVLPMPTNVIYLSSLLGRDGPNLVHKCDWKCENENVCGNMYHCKLTRLTHICDKNCEQRILYDNHFPLSQAEQQAIRGVKRKMEESRPPADSYVSKRRRNNAHIHPSPFEKAFSAVGPICSQIGDGMDMS